MKASQLLTLFMLVGILNTAELFAQKQEQLVESNAGVTTVSGDDLFYIAVEEMPEFIGGQQKLNEYITHELHYPNASKEKGIQGTVYIGFVVKANGSISNAKVIRGVKNGDDLNAEALRIISGMPAWKPGRQNGKNVSVQFTFPIKFALSE